MYLIVDFSDLNLEYTKTDIRFDESNADFTVGRLIMEFCKGVEFFAGEEIPNKTTLYLLGPNGKLVDSASCVADLCKNVWNDWDTIYLMQRR